MIPFAFLVLVVVALVVLVALREVHRRIPTGTGRGRVARVGSVVVAVSAVVVVARLVVAPLPSDRTLTWKPGVVFDAAHAEASVVRIEVERPACAPDGDGWIATPTVTDTPLAVFITIRMANSFNVPVCTGMLGYQGGRLPTVGGYLTGTYLDIHLTEALGGRLLFDGAGLLPELRPQLR